MRDGGGELYKIPKNGWCRKDGRGNRNFKKGKSKLGQGMGALKREGELEPLLTNYVILAFNILLECIERNTFFKIGEQLNYLMIV